MRLEDFSNIIPEFMCGSFKSMAMIIGAKLAFMISEITPDADSLIKNASGLTGWGLAIACIYTLAKTVKTLFAKIEEKDKIINDMHQTAVSKAEDQREEMLDELKKINK